MDQSDAGDAGVAQQAASSLIGVTKPVTKKRFVDGGLTGGEYPNRDGGVRIPQSDGGEVTCVVEHDGQIAGGSVVRDRGDRAVVDPRVSSPDVAKGVLGDPDGEVPARWCRELRKHPPMVLVCVRGRRDDPNERCSGQEW